MTNDCCHESIGPSHYKNDGITEPIKEVLANHLYSPIWMSLFFDLTDDPREAEVFFFIECCMLHFIQNQNHH